VRYDAPCMRVKVMFLRGFSRLSTGKKWLTKPERFDRKP
jgi:hypothetical protein